jgi:hypothetical protein
MCAFFSLVVLITGCKKENLQPENTVENPIITLSPLGQVDWNGKSILVTWSVEGKLRSLSVKRNGIEISTKLKDSVLVSGITINQNFELNAITPNGDSIKRFLEIIVPNVQPIPEFIYIRTKGIIPYGTRDTIWYLAEHATDVCYIYPDGTKMILPAEGYIPMGVLCKDTTYHLQARGVGGTTSVEVSTVIIPMTRYQIVTQQQGWNPILKYIEFPNGYRDTIQNLSNGGWLYKFTTGGNCLTYDIATGALIGYCPWSFMDNESKILVGYTGGQLFQIKNISEDKMILLIQEDCYGCPQGTTYIAEYTYILYSP